MFYIGGAGPLLLQPVLWLKLPESLRILVIRKRGERQIAGILSRMGHPTIAAHRLISQDRDLGFAVAYLFQDHRAAPTLLLWMAFFMNLATLYFLTNWITIITNDAGVSVSEAVLITAMFQVGGTVGAVALGRLIDWLSAHGVLGTSFFGAALLIAAMGVAGNSFIMLAMLSFGAGFCVVGSQIGANALASTFYPAAARATGHWLGARDRAPRRNRRAAPRWIAGRPTLVDRHRVRVGRDPIDLRFDCHSGDGLGLGDTPAPEPVALTDG